MKLTRLVTLPRIVGWAGYIEIEELRREMRGLPMFTAVQLAAIWQRADGKFPPAVPVRFYEMWKRGVRAGFDDQKEE